MLGFGICNSAQESGIPPTIWIRNPSSTEIESWIQYLVESVVHSVNLAPKTMLDYLTRDDTKATALNIFLLND